MTPPPTVYCGSRVFQGTTVRSCGVDCTACSGFAQNNDGTVAGLTGTIACTSSNTSGYFPSFYGATAAAVFWEWQLGGGGVTFELHCALQDTTLNFGACVLSLSAGEFALYFNVFANDQWLEKVNGFNCNASTTRISGAHTFSAGSKCVSTNCGGNPTIVVPG